MKTLKTYLTDNRIDGHIHLFDHSGVLSDKVNLNHCSKMIGFMDIQFMNLDKYEHDDVIKYYDDYIENYLTNNTILLATGKDAETVIDVYKKHPDVIKGFGELKCYPFFHDHLGNRYDLPFGNLDWIRPICEFDKDLRLPIYIHWSLYDDACKDALIDLISSYPTIPFVLCHCGMSDDNKPNKDQYDTIVKLTLRFSNLFVDISYDALKFFIDNPVCLNAIQGRYIVGTDLNMIAHKRNKIAKYLNNYKQLYKCRLKCFDENDLFN